MSRKGIVCRVAVPLFLLVSACGSSSQTADAGDAADSGDGAAPDGTGPLDGAGGDDGLGGWTLLFPAGLELCG
jgi:hypothetical protein